MVKKEDQTIMAIPTGLLFIERSFQGFQDAEVYDFKKLILSSAGWMRRGDIEQNSEIKHPIPYCIIANPETKRVFVYQRAGKHDEQRLSGKYSWGVGGHVEFSYSALPNPVIYSMLRELREEVGTDGFQEPELLGYINDDSNSVGQVHFGLLYLVGTESDVKPKDSEIAHGGMKTISEIEAICRNPELEVEQWSKIAFEPLKKALAS